MSGPPRVRTPSGQDRLMSGPPRVRTASGQEALGSGPPRVRTASGQDRLGGEEGAGLRGGGATRGRARSGRSKPTGSGAVPADGLVVVPVLPLGAVAARLSGLPLPAHRLWNTEG
ncbi:hypothetical protein EYF80_049049 [Liparis tanakae]|uniref:Uncharacterized protein n=1 Tax=Liparis tanakae TaxID=230148 RepID=A0A4Z2FIM9_9TELE|nr:hypothetical protein EYF80_049049 [Liparis tanakae]